MRLIALLPFLGACALSHQLGDGTDLGVAPDAASRDAGPDAPLPSSCTARWATLPWCPADPMAALGTRCTQEGMECNQCCGPTPAVACISGVWTRTEPSADCRGIRCPAIPSCGAGRCWLGSICLHPSSELVEPDRCVRPPFTVSSCGDVPDGWLTSDPHSCMTCSCRTPTRSPEISLDCPCCDVGAAAP